MKRAYFSIASSLGADTPDGEDARHAFFSASSYDGGWCEDFLDHLKDQPLEKDDRILSAIEDTLFDIAESAYAKEGLISSDYGYSVKSQPVRQGIASWAYGTAREVVRGVFGSVSEIEDEADALAREDAERARELDFLASER